MRTIGLQTHIWNNRLVWLITLIAGSVCLFIYTSFVIWAAPQWWLNPKINFMLEDTGQTTLISFAQAFSIAVDFTVLILGAYIGVIYLFLYVVRLQMRRLARLTDKIRAKNDQKRCFKLLEPLAIELGMPTPKIGILPFKSRNALSCMGERRQKLLLVTEGLLDALTDAELRAVLARQLMAFKNGDIQRQLIVSAVVLAPLAAIILPVYLIDAISDSKKDRPTKKISHKPRTPIFGCFVIICGILFGFPTALFIIFWIAPFLAGLILYMVLYIPKVLLLTPLHARHIYATDGETIRLLKDTQALLKSLKICGEHAGLPAHEIPLLSFIPQFIEAQTPNTPEEAPLDAQPSKKNREVNNAQDRIKKILQVFKKSTIH